MTRYLVLTLTDTVLGDVDTAQRQFDDADKPAETEKAYRRVAAFMQQDMPALLGDKK
jgi:hypothetical protein